MLRVVRTENGLVKGIEAADPRITAFKGIPFAAPPTGRNRWRAPQPCEDWEGIRETYRFAPISVQDTPGIGDNIYIKEWHVDPEIEMSEDCLYLNVWTGAKSAQERQPVVVWFFGGGLQWGYPSEMEFDGERLARRGIVVVTVNYRLNVFGFLAHPELTQQQPEAPANFGSLDQQAGIRWVIRNIAAFGGDPENITIAGQSAGGGSVMSQLTSPQNTGLFQKAIIQSALIYDPYTQKEVSTVLPLEEAEKQGEQFFAFLGVKTLEEARQLDAFYIRDRYAAYACSYPRMFPVLDGLFCVGEPKRLFMENKRLMVPLMAGNTADEFPNRLCAASEEELTAEAQRLFGQRAQEFLQLAKVAGKDSLDSFGQINGIECTAKAMFTQNALLGNTQDCYYYRFDTDIPGEDHPGTFHSSELWFFFETLAKCWRPFAGRHYDLARQMCNYWTNFVKTGNPNGLDADGTPLPEWKPYTADAHNSMVFGRDGCYQETEDLPLVQLLAAQIREKLSKE